MSQTILPGMETMTARTLTTDDLKHVGIMRRYQNTSFAAIEADERGIPDNVKVNYQKIKHYAEDIDSKIHDGVGLVLSGDYGTMKTTLAVAVLRHWLERGIMSRGMFVPMCSLIDNLFTMRSGDREEWARYENRIRNTTLLVIDDLGGELAGGQEWVLSKVDSIITERYNKMLPVIITTNFNKEQLVNSYSGRLIDRIRSSCMMLTFHGHSQRRNAEA